ncbi:TonB-dependent receptor domain-containing protein [Ectothiorhodospira sp. 9100]|uniref:TonB-dependent receptor domain-containing protein n=1 Tax=Ectothiorhodospira sp. 9100 TaxID=2897388 RepID=UPI001EE99966|nr:TonB-dependent receptor [Ectothiorhodospira sp. 9100]MCG5516859.1 TonB-dependent receptor [Ectothiorhodospira sp. 9100]
MQTRSFLPAAVLLAIPSFVSAQEQLAQLDPILVTPTRTAQTTDQTLASVTVIDREEIERLQPKEFVDLLRGRAGIGVSQNGAFGKSTSIFMRGTNSDHTLLLVDGVRMGSATTGGASWQFLPPSEIERIEIVRGPRTSLYGSDAIGGVIQVFTKKGDGPARVRAHLGAGSFNAWEIGAGVSGANESTRYNFSANHSSTDGINVQDGVGDDGRDGYENTSVTASLSHDIAEGPEFFATVFHSEGETEFDATEKDWYRFSHGAAQLGLRGQVTDVWFSSLSLAHSRDELNRRGVSHSQFNTARNLISLQNDFFIGQEHILTLGADYLEDRVTASEDFSQTSRDNVGLFGQWQADVGQYDIALSLRHDDNEAFGTETTGQMALGIQLASDWSGRASVGTAFNAPTFNQLYYPGYGNQDVKPERSETFEAGVRYSSGNYYGDVALFQTNIEDLIPVFPVENIDNARIRGVELEAGLEVNYWSFRAALTHLDHEDRDTGKKLERRPENSGRLDLDRYWNRFSVGATVTAEGYRFNDKENEDRLGGFALVDLRASYNISTEWTLNAKLDNVLDKDYVTTRSRVYDFTQDSSYYVDYNQPGRAFFVTLNYQQQ